MNIIDAAQGSSAWHAHRATHFNASDAPAMLGLSPYKTRAQLLREIATGITPDIDTATQRRFDDGHRFEALARPLAEQIIGEDLYPVVGYEGKLSASFDGLTMDSSVCFEHKTLNAAYREAITTGSALPDALLVQIEQQLWVSQAERCLFMASKWTEDGALVEEVHCMVESDPDLLKKVMKGWDQFQYDLENYQHEDVVVKPVSAAVEALPAVMVQVSGSIAIVENFKAFGVALHDFLDNKLMKNPQTDQDFADLESQIKMMKKAEDALDAAEANMLAQVSSVDEAKRTKDMLRSLVRENRLMAEKLLKAEKENRRAEIVRDASLALNAHVAKLGERIGGNWMPVWSMQIFNDAIKGMKSLDSMRDKLASALANEKIAANEVADRIELNQKAITVDGANYNYLVHDFAQICTKAPEDFSAIIAQRIAKHKADDAARIEAERVAAEAKTAAAVAAAIEAERMAEAKRVADAAAQDQRGKPPVSESEGAINQAQDQVAERQSTPPTTEKKRVVEADDDISTFMASRDFGKEPSKIREILVEFVKHQASRALKAAA